MGVAERTAPDGVRGAVEIGARPPERRVPVRPLLFDMVDVVHARRQPRRQPALPAAPDPHLVEIHAPVVQELRVLRPPVRLRKLQRLGSRRYRAAGFIHHHPDRLPGLRVVARALTGGAHENVRDLPARQAVDVRLGARLRHLLLGTRDEEVLVVLVDPHDRRAAGSRQHRHRTGNSQQPRLSAKGRWPVVPVSFLVHRHFPFMFELIASGAMPYSRSRRRSFHSHASTPP